VPVYSSEGQGHWMSGKWHTLHHKCLLMARQLAHGTLGTVEWAGVQWALDG